MAADGLAPRRFVEFYECSYRQFCWNTHGSGLTGLDLSIDLVPSLTLFAFKELGHFAIVAAEMAVRLAGAWDAEMERLFGEVGVVRERAVAMVFGKHKGVGPLATKDPAK